MYEAAAPPKTWREYDCGHDVDGFGAACRDRVTFFAEAARRAPGASLGPCCVA
jgi:hypothetical protein